MRREVRRLKVELQGLLGGGSGERVRPSKGAASICRIGGWNVLWIQWFGRSTESVHSHPEVLPGTEKVTGWWSKKTAKLPTAGNLDVSCRNGLGAVVQLQERPGRRSAMAAQWSGEIGTSALRALIPEPEARAASTDPAGAGN